MYEILKAGGFTKGGLNFDAKTRRGSFEFDDIFLAYIAGIDSFALGLRIADKLISDGRIDTFIKERYASYNSGIGADIVSNKATMADLEKYALTLGEVKTLKSGRQEYLESVMNSIMFN
jgi:xylose isomerase